MEGTFKVIEDQRNEPPEAPTVEDLMSMVEPSSGRPDRAPTMREMVQLVALLDRRVESIEQQRRTEAEADEIKVDEVTAEADVEAIVDLTDEAKPDEVTASTSLDVDGIMASLFGGEPASDVPSLASSEEAPLATSSGAEPQPIVILRSALPWIKLGAALAVGYGVVRLVTKQGEQQVGSDNAQRLSGAHRLSSAQRLSNAQRSNGALRCGICGRSGHDRRSCPRR